MKKNLKLMLAIMIAAFTFASCSDVPSPYGLFAEDGDGEIEGASGTGTLEDPFNVPGVLNYINTLEAGAQSDVVYVKGIVSSLVDGQNYDGGFGNGTFYISIDGDQRNQFEVYRALYLENQSYVDGPIANLGDEVIICGKVTTHGSTPETVEKEAYLYSINGMTHYDAQVHGSADNPLTVAQALEIINTLDNNTSAGNGYVKGIVCSAPTSISAGKLTYYISDDGKNANSVQVYKGLGLEKAQFSAASDIAVGDEVVVFGPLYKYVNANNGNVTNEINDGNYLISLKKAEGGGGTEETIGTKDAPKTVAEAITLINALGDKETSQQKAYVKGKVVKVTTNQTNFEKYGNLNYFISDDGQDANTIQVYAGDGLNGDKFQSITDIKQGDEVIVYGNLYKFVNNNGTTPEITNSYLVALNDSEGGGEQGSGEGGEATQMTKSVNDLTVTFTATGVSEGNTVTYDLTTCGLEHQTENPSFTLNNANFTFSQETGNTTPKYWLTTTGTIYNEFRMYAQNKLVITGTSNIAKVVFTCTKNGSNNATGNAQSYATVNGKTFTFINDWTSSSSGTQFRFNKVAITYAK